MIFDLDIWRDPT